MKYQSLGGGHMVLAFVPYLPYHDKIYRINYFVFCVCNVVSFNHTQMRSTSSFLSFFHSFALSLPVPLDFISEIVTM